MELVKNNVNLWYIIRKAVFQRKPIEWRLELLKTQRLKYIKKEDKNNKRLHAPSITWRAIQK